MTNIQYLIDKKRIYMLTSIFYGLVFIAFLNNELYILAIAPAVGYIGYSYLYLDTIERIERFYKNEY